MPAVLSPVEFETSALASGSLIYGGADVGCTVAGSSGDGVN